MTLLLSYVTEFSKDDFTGNLVGYLGDTTEANGCKVLPFSPLNGRKSLSNEEFIAINDVHRFAVIQIKNGSVVMLATDKKWKSKCLLDCELGIFNENKLDVRANDQISLCKLEKEQREDALNYATLHQESELYAKVKDAIIRGESFEYTLPSRPSKTSQFFVKISKYIKRH